MHVEVGDDPVALGEGLGLVAAGGPPAAPRVRVVALERLGDERESPRPRLPARRASASRSRAAASSVETEQRRGGELRLAREAGRVDDRAARGRRLGAQPARARRATGRRSQRRSEHLGARAAGERRPHVNAVAERERDRRPRGELAGPQQRSPPSRRSPRRARSTARTTGRLPAELSITIACCLRVGREDGRGRRPAGRSRSRRGSARAPREPRPRRRREERVDPREQAVALVAPWRVAEPLGVDERRRGRRLGLEQCDVREARDGPGRSRGRRRSAPRRSAVATFARTPTGIPTAGRGETGTARASATTPSSSPRCSARAAREQIGRAQRRREHDDAVPACAERVRDARPRARSCRAARPRVRGHEADAERHGRRIVGGSARRLGTLATWTRSRSPSARTGRTRSSARSRWSTPRARRSRSRREGRSRSAAAGTRGRSRSATRRTSGSGSSPRSARRPAPG